MNDTKYGKYIVTDLNKAPDSLGTRVYCLHGGVFEGAPYVDCAWFWPQPEEVVVVDKGHTHDFGEVVTFFGSNPDDPTDQNYIYTRNPWNINIRNYQIIIVFFN